MRLALTFCPDGLIRRLAATLPADEVTLELVPPDGDPSEDPGWDVILASAGSLRTSGSPDPIRRLRDRYRRLPILAVAETDDPALVVSALEAGADAVMRRPIDTRELRLRLRKLSTLRHAPPDRIVWGSLHLHRTRHTVEGPRGRVHVTPLEHRILQLLMLRAGEAVPRSEIHRSVWGTENPGSGNLLEVHVSRLRKKLRAIGGEGVLRTARGVGYFIGS